jgi:anti-sigma B factor antagonist
MAQPPARVPSRGGSAGDGLALVAVGDLSGARILVIGELDCGTAPRLTRLLGDLLDAGYRRIDLDLSRLAFLAAAGLTVFCEATARCDEAGGRLRLTGVTPRISRILGITGLDTVLAVQVPISGNPRLTVGAAAAQLRDHAAHEVASVHTAE